LHPLFSELHSTVPATTSTPSAKALPAIDTDRCTGCGWCIAVCPPHVLSLQVQQGGPAWGPKRSVLHDAPACTGCALCAVRCPFDAIHMVRNQASAG
jgi:ferredoxin